MSTETKDSKGEDMNESCITVTGVPLNEALGLAQSIEIAQHFHDEVSTRGKQCGLRRCPSKPKMSFGRPGRPKKAVSITLLTDLEPFLKDDSYSLAGISELFGLSVSELQFYMRRLGLHRKRGRKPRFEQRRAA
jgi:hypothetical protein